jgi:hypothetical protein
MSNTTTQRDARQYVVAAIEASGIATAAEYDLDAICDALYDLAGGWDVTQIDHDAFWLIVADNER